MPVPIPDTITPRAPGAGDMFLSVTGAKCGQIAGEAHDQKHKNEIEVLGWSWGMQGKNAFGGVQATGRATIRELRITKRFDKSSTALMSALRTNEPIKKAILTLRKTGKTPLEYLIITIENGRVMTVDLDAGDAANSPTLIERVAFSFNKITVAYTPQGPDGQSLGGTSFEDTWENTT
ncbi:MAG: type VI secretion system tube protein Hcp [Vicinamibacterales bacterium]